MTRSLAITLFALPALLVTAPVAGAQCFEQQLNASDAADTDVLGWCLDLDGDLFAAGAIGDDPACPLDPNCNSGSVYVFRRAGGVWSEEAKLANSDGAFGDQFGHDVAVSGDRVLVGAHLKEAGAAYVYRFDGASWSEEQKLLGSGIQNQFHFGHSVALDGEVALVGTMRDDHQGFETGSAYVFEYDGASWVERAKLVAGDAAMGDRYGRSCDLDGDVVAIGAHLHDDLVAGADAGAAYVYERDDAGTPNDPSDDTWPEAAALRASDAIPGMVFGRSVDLSGDVLLVGAEFAQNGSAVDTGAAYLFFRTGSGWTEVQKLVASDGLSQDRFGISVSLDGIYALVGARGVDGNAGAVYVFTRTASGYIETGKLQGPNTASGDQLGHETGVQVSGTTAVIGARFNAAAVPGGGTVYTYSLDDCLGTAECAGDPNSAGPGAVIEASGIEAVTVGDFTLTATGGIPNKVGLFFYGPNANDVPLGNGRLCIGGGIARLNPAGFADGAGVAVRAIDFGVAPAGSGPNAITPGSTWRFQYWYRDPAAGGAAFNLSNATAVTFLP